MQFPGDVFASVIFFVGMQALLNANDFIGLSAYGSGYPTDASQLTYRSAEIPLYTLAYELSFFGIDLKAYIDRPVLYVEQVRSQGIAKHACHAAPMCNLLHAFNLPQGCSASLLHSCAATSTASA